jgi:signal transduction histidine kinase
MVRGRLFWKFFFFFWLAQFVTSIGVGAAMWLLHPEHAHSPQPAPCGPAGFERAPPAPDAFPGHSAPSLRGGPGPQQGKSPLPLLMPPLMPIIAGSLVSLLFAALLAWYFARPIHHLRTAFAALTDGRLDTRVGAAMSDRRDELADLGKDFDRMAERLQGLLETQRRLLHDVSHELRSPLARLQAAVGLLRQQPERSTEYIQRIERDTTRMDQLVGELLTLARLDAGMAGKMDDEVDLCEIVADVVEDARFEADGKACRIDIEDDVSAIVPGNHALIQRALENLVRNAVRHSPDGGRIVITVSLDVPAEKVRLEVSDQGPGVFEGDLEAIFTPFFRSGAADAFSGYGLGLAIARRVALAHRGSIHAVNRPEGGLAVTLILPSAQRV